VIVFVPATVSYDDLLLAMSGIGTVERTPDGGFVVLGSDRVYVHRLDDPETYYDHADLSLVASIVGDYAAYTLDYTDIRTVKEALDRLETQWRCVIDNDHGVIAAGREFTARMRQDPDWDWRGGSPA